MTNKIRFAKMVANGNDFIILEKGPKFAEKGLNSLAKNLCDRKYGIGADGLLLVDKAKATDVRMRIFNPDGSEAEMCGNGARCVALYVREEGGKKIKKEGFKIETKAGILEAYAHQDSAKIKLTDPKDYMPDIGVCINGRDIKVNFINTGVPHTVVFVQGIEDIEAAAIGRQIRYHQRFAPLGTNVNFVEIIGQDDIKIRTYERGVEDETLACGTGSVAAALITSLTMKDRDGKQRIKVLTRSGEILKVYFAKQNEKISDVWLEGKARIVYRGEIKV